jgi:hypothetical protein
MSNITQPAAPPAIPVVQVPERPSEVHKLQFDYAWKWFSFHADQRTKMFNFMLIVFGILATAIVAAVDKHLSREITSGLCVIAGVLALIFSRLDRRNQNLLWLGEDVLVELERRGIFGEGIRIDGREEGQRVDLGILWRQKLEERENRTGLLGSAWSGKHRFWLPRIAYLFAVIFFLAAWLLWKQNPPVDCFS